MEINKLRTLFYKRWKFYTIGYIFGYVFSIVYMGVPNVLYIIPIKLSCIIFAIILGTAFYYGSKKMMVFEIVFRMIKYGVIVAGLIILSTAFQYLMSKIGVDLSPFIGL